MREIINVDQVQRWHVTSDGFGVSYTLSGGTHLLMATDTKEHALDILAAIHDALASGSRYVAIDPRAKTMVFV